MQSDVLYNSLVEIGLDQFEADLYIALITVENPNVSQLAKHLGVERLTVYRGLGRLQEAGLVEKKSDYSRQINLESPSAVASLLKHKQSVIKNLSESLNSLLPDLNSQYYQNQRQPKVRFYENRESFMLLLDEMVDEADGELYVVGSADILNFVPDYMEIYIKNRQKKHVISKTISFQSQALAIRDHNKELRELRWLPSEYNCPATYIAYGNKVAIWNTALPKIIVIEDKIVFDFFKALFDILWKTSEE